ncbi:hypothetical protein CHLRE_15g643389v5 [Chlamydomonas reinhardtii]|uniref:F-box domain-containing protein n=1 Tax=Chlamydomonas reinhardtii TaxID=3055 RepID=A0A2K3CX01_CHLRE|nr:uncharacterized protein CHLRE_21g751897v5 [Chlamydomonas reinhardtii]XP_042916575.1 uncharacterized protein CHLRE_15g643389v5 [Chlamydomonas reinhardtii]PNW69745.1 hypothetical protein CHLRE_21g751897v5 [Chlamydomonas reinhardtii]PNW72816.1 hypothetical protein CHLRE_15g643389v5 [Chlamydomonas reinhardtii]
MAPDWQNLPADLWLHIATFLNTADGATALRRTSRFLRNTLSAPQHRRVFLAGPHTYTGYLRPRRLDTHVPPPGWPGRAFQESFATAAAWAHLSLPQRRRLACLAAASGHAASATAAIQYSGVAMNTETLASAAQAGLLHLCQQLISHGCALTCSAFVAAGSAGHLDVLTLLFDTVAHADPQDWQELYNSTQQGACIGGHSSVLDFLNARFAQHDAWHTLPASSIKAAAARGHTTLVERALQHAPPYSWYGAYWRAKIMDGIAAGCSTQFLHHVLTTYIPEWPHSLPLPLPADPAAEPPAVDAPAAQQPPAFPAVAPPAAPAPPPQQPAIQEALPQPPAPQPPDPSVVLRVCRSITLAASQLPVPNTDSIQLLLLRAPQGWQAVATDLLTSDTFLHDPNLRNIPAVLATLAAAGVAVPQELRNRLLLQHGTPDKAADTVLRMGEMAARHCNAGCTLFSSTRDEGVILLRDNRPRAEAFLRRGFSITAHDLHVVAQTSSWDTVAMVAAAVPPAHPQDTWAYNSAFTSAARNGAPLPILQLLHDRGARIDLDAIAMGGSEHAMQWAYDLLLQQGHQQVQSAGAWTGAILLGPPDAPSSFSSAVNFALWACNLPTLRVLRATPDGMAVAAFNVLQPTTPTAPGNALAPTPGPPTITNTSDVAWSVYGHGFEVVHLWEAWHAPVSVDKWRHLHAAVLHMMHSRHGAPPDMINVLPYQLAWVLAHVP